VSKTSVTSSTTSAIKHAIPRSKRIVIALRQAEGYWSLVTNPIMLFILGWTPIFLGGSRISPGGTLVQPAHHSARPADSRDVWSRESRR
jgi:hypothetical protein